MAFTPKRNHEYCLCQRKPSHIPGEAARHHTHHNHITAGLNHHSQLKEEDNMINGSYVNTTSFEDNFEELTWPERGIIFVYILVIMVVSTVGNTFVLILAKDLKNVTKDSKGSILLINIAFVDLLFNVFLTFRKFSTSWMDFFRCSDLRQRITGARMRRP
eukprot:sb/3472900/